MTPAAPQPLDRALPEELLSACLAELEHRGPEALEEACSRHPEHAELLRRRVRVLAEADLIDVEGSLDELAGPLGDFVLREPLGSGGMGIVRLARQASTGRLVAVKLVRPEQLVFAESRARFRREVELVSRLHHPAILPILAVGETRGVPWYAMELVRGPSLAALLAGLRPPDAPSVDPRRIDGAHLAALLAAATPDALRERADVELPGWKRWSLTAAREVALALAHAHDKGVLHRDVKPSNVLVDARGRPYLTDFGLASPQGEGSLTRASAAVGSLPYLAPEVLGGAPASVQSDVWGLGVLLYELLCLRRPHEAASTPALVRAILTDDPTPPRRAAPYLDADVVAVLLRALARQPERRYATAVELARDLDNLLEHRPTLARNPGPLRRLAQAARRRPARAVAVGLGALLVVAGPVGWELSQLRAGRVLRATAAREAAAHARSERHFQAARAAVGQVLRLTATDDLEDVPRLQLARLAAIDRALELFAALEPDRTGDAETLAEGARLHVARADVLYDLGRLDEGCAEAQRGAERLNELWTREPSLERCLDLADARNLLGKLLQAAAEHAAALPVQRACVDLLRGARADFPEEPDVARRLVVALANLAESEEHVLGPAVARETLAEAEEGARALLDAAPREARYVWPLGRVALDRSALALAAGDREQAERLADEGLALHRRAAELAQDSRFYAFDVASAWRARAAVARGHQAFVDEEAALREALAIVQGLLRDFPLSARLLREEYELREALGVSASAQGRVDEASAAFGALLADAEARLAREPESPSARVAAALAGHNLANARIQAGAPGEALEPVRRALAQLEPCRGSVPPAGDVELLRRSLEYLRALALCLADRPEQALVEVEAFDAAAADARGLRLAADLWCELLLAWERAAASGTSAPASALALAGERALVALERAAEAGYDDHRELATTPALEPLRRTPRFAAVLARARRSAGDPGF